MLHKLPDKMPVNLNRRKGRTHADQNENDVDLNYDEDGLGKFVFVAHVVFSFISFDKFLTFFLFCRGRGGRRTEDSADSTKGYEGQPGLFICSQGDRVLH